MPSFFPPPIDRESDMPAPHNTLELEDRMLSYVEYGQVQEVLELFQQPLEERAGKMRRAQLEAGTRRKGLYFRSYQRADFNRRIGRLFKDEADLSLQSVHA